MSGRHLAHRATAHLSRRARRLLQGAGAALTASALVAATSGASSSTATYTDAAAGQFYVATGEWCPSVVSTEAGPVVFERATGLPTAHPHVMCSPSDTYRAYWQSDGNFVVYRMSPWTAVTTASSGGSDGLVLGTDGNLVLSIGGVPMRSTGTAGIPGPVALRLDDAGVLTITDATGAVRWTGSTATSHPCPPTAGEFLCTP